MGVFTEGRITACFETLELAKQFKVLAENFGDYFDLIKDLPIKFLQSIVNHFNQ